MSDKQFEHIIKTKLSGFKSDLTPDWELFLEKKKTAAEAIVTPFDNQLKEKLDGYQSKAIPNWNAFLAHKDKAAPDVNEEETPFDTQLKTTLEDYQTTALPQWNAFTAFRDTKGESQADETFDETLRNNLEDYNTDTQPQWTAFLDYRTAADANRADDYFDDRVRSEFEEYQELSEPQWDAFTAYRAAYIDGSEDSAFDADVFDAGIRNKLDTYQTDKTPEWAAFLSHRERLAKDNPDSGFDEQVRSGVAGYVLANAVPQWEKFKQQKAQADADYSNEIFDKHLVSTFDNYKASSEPQWAKFLEKKRKSDAVYADASFDSTVGQRLGNMKVRYNSEHWLLLKSRLENIAKLRKQIFTYKTLEMLFVSLMLFTFGNHLYLFVNDKIAEPVVQAEITTGIDPVQSAASQKLIKTNTSSESNESNSSATVSSDQNSAGTITPAFEGGFIAEGSNEDGTNNTGEAKDNVAGVSFGDGNSGIGNDGVGLIGTESGNSGQELQGNILSENKEELQDVQPSLLDNSSRLDAVDRSLMQRLDALILAQPQALSSMIEDKLRQPEDAKYIDLRAKKKYTDEGSWIHVYNAMTNNYISTPLNTDIGLPGITHQMYGYATELLVSKQKGRWELESGLGYSMLNYTPYDSGLIDYNTACGRRTVDFQRINIDFVSVPLKLKYHFIANGRWSIFTGLGLNNDFIARTTYEIEDILENPRPKTEMQDPLPSELPPFYNREFTTGILGNAPEVPAFVDYKTKSNSFLLRGNISLGAERNVSDKFAAYIRATYDHTLYNKEIGPYNDELNKVSFGMGFKMRLK